MNIKKISFLLCLAAAVFLFAACEEPTITENKKNITKNINGGIFSVDKFNKEIKKATTVNIKGDTEIWGTGGILLSGKTINLTGNLTIERDEPLTSSQSMAGPLFSVDPANLPPADVIVFIDGSTISGSGKIISEGGMNCYVAGASEVDTTVFENFVETTILEVESPEKESSWGNEISLGYTSEYEIKDSGDIPDGKTLYVVGELKIEKERTDPLTGNIVAFDEVTISSYSSAIASPNVDFSSASKVSIDKVMDIDFGGKFVAFLTIPHSVVVTVNGNTRLTGAIDVSDTPLTLKSGTFTISDSAANNSSGKIIAGSNAVVYNFGKYLEAVNTPEWTYEAASELWTNLDFTPTTGVVDKNSSGLYKLFGGTAAADKALIGIGKGTKIVVKPGLGPMIEFLAADTNGGTITVIDPYELDYDVGSASAAANVGPGVTLNLAADFSVKESGVLNVLGTVKIDPDSGNGLLLTGDANVLKASRITGTGSVIIGNTILTAAAGKWQPDAGWIKIAGTNGSAILKGTAALKASNNAAIVLGNTTTSADLIIDTGVTLDLSSGGKIDIAGQSSLSRSNLFFETNGILKLGNGNVDNSGTKIEGENGKLEFDSNMTRKAMSGSIPAELSEIKIGSGQGYIKTEVSDIVVTLKSGAKINN